MTWKTFETKEEYKVALRRTIEIFHAEENTLESDELDHLLNLVRLMRIFIIQYR